jgi:hypothetical protein
VVVGGGALTDPSTDGSLKPIGSFPSDSAGNPVANNATNPTSWTADGLNGGQTLTGTTTKAFVVCAPASSISTKVLSTEVDGPTTASTKVTTTVSCPATGATMLLGGGIFASDDGNTPQHGVHLRGSFPSDASGNAVTSGSAGSWTGVDQSGGMAALNTDTTVFALCANP